MSDDGSDAVETLAVVDAVLRRASTGAPLDDLVSALCDVVDVAVEGSCTVMYLTGRPAPAPPLGGEQHRALIDAAVGRAASTGEWSTLTLPAGSWPTAWVVPAVTDDGAECVGVLVVWRVRPGVPAPVASDPLHRAVRLSVITLGNHAEAGALRRAERTDPLTGLANRRHLESVLAEIDEDADSGRCAALLLDVDDFAALNEAHGFESADHVLVIIGERLRGALRARDLVCRWGGDEFVVLCRDVVDEEEVHHVGDRLRRVISQPMAVDEVSIVVTVSATVVMSPDDEPATGLVERIRTAVEP